MRYKELDKSHQLNELFGFGKKKEKSVVTPSASAPTPASVETPTAAPTVKDLLHQQWESAKAETNAILKKADNQNDPELKQFVSDMKQFSQELDKTFDYIGDPNSFKNAARIAAQKYVKFNQKYFSKNKSAPRAQGATSKFSMEGQNIYANINKKLLPFFKELQKRIT